MSDLTYVKQRPPAWGQAGTGRWRSAARICQTWFQGAASDRESGKT
jgi:hypothetical protein